MGRPPKGQVWRVVVLCVHCGSKYQVTRARAATTRYCSKGCHIASQVGRPPHSTEWYRDHGRRQTGENHPLWKGGPSRYQAVHRQWCRRNADKVSIRNANRRARRRAADGSFTLTEWLQLKAAHGGRCALCGQLEPQVKLTVDHVKPLKAGGSNKIENIQPLCGSCNSRKKDSWEAA